MTCVVILGGLLILHLAQKNKDDIES